MKYGQIHVVVTLEFLPVNSCLRLSSNPIAADLDAEQSTSPGDPIKPAAEAIVTICLYYFQAFEEGILWLYKLMIKN